MSSLRQAIEARIEAFLESDDPRFPWLREGVQKHNFLPLFLNFAETHGIRADGSFVKWLSEHEPEKVVPLLDPHSQLVALCEGVKLYPELRSLLPQRPPEAVTCHVCGGSGKPGDVDLICKCGGIGWLVPDALK